MIKEYKLILKGHKKIGWIMGHTHLKAIETLIICNNNKRQNKDRATPVSAWILFHTYTTKNSEGNQEWKITPLARTKQSNIVNKSTTQYCNRFRTTGLGAQEPSVDKVSQIRVGDWWRKIFIPRHRDIKDTWVMSNHPPFQYQEKNIWQPYRSFTTQINPGKLICHCNVWLW